MTSRTAALVLTTKENPSMADRTSTTPQLRFDDTADFDDAGRGLVGRLEPGLVTDEA